MLGIFSFYEEIIVSQMIKPQLPTGMRDFLPADVLRRQYVIDTISAVFQRYGYEPLQTPVMELMDTLIGKYGEDAEKLIFHAKHPQGKEELALRGACRRAERSKNLAAFQALSDRACVAGRTPPARALP